MAPFLAILLMTMLAPPRAGARELPVLTVGGQIPDGPAWRGDALILKLRPGPARAAASRGTALAGRGARGSLGLPAVDALASRLGGVNFEPMMGGGAPMGRLRETADLAGFYRVNLPAGLPLEQALRNFAALAEVESAEPIGVVAVSGGFPPNDSLFSLSTWFYQSSRRDIHVAEGWSVWTGDTSMVVGILDTGVLPYHPDLAGTVAGLRGQLFTNWAEQGGVAGIDDDGNGFIDDFSGWDFVAAAAGGPFPVGEDVDTADNDPTDFAGHGTRVAGIVGALTDNGIGVAGTAPQVRLMPLRVGWSTNARPLGLVDMSYVADAITYGAANGATVLNASFETVQNSALDAAIAAAARAGVIVVFAAGNSGGSNDEQRRGDVIAVAATDATDHVSGTSNLGSFVDVAAPGVGVLSTSLLHDTVNGLPYSRPSYGPLDGTSFAAPMVAGAVALYESRRRVVGGPLLDATNMALRLWDTADYIGSLNPGVTGYGGGRLNVGRLLLEPQVSRAYRSGGRSVGPTIVVHERSGTRLCWVANNRTLVIENANTGETLSVNALPGNLARQLAAADLGGGRGVGVFAGTSNGRMCGFSLGGTVLPGWPYAASSGFTQFLAGPALGDLDGDGVLEVVAGSVDGTLWAWTAGGALLPGFPVAAGGLGFAGAVALANVDGEAGDEIIAAGKDGQLHAVRFDAGEAAGFPVAVPGPIATVSPVIGRLGVRPAIVVAGGTQVHAFEFDGTPRWNFTLAGGVAFEPALADFRADGFDEVVLATSGPNALAVIDTGGVAMTSRGWPLALSAAPAGPPVIGPVAAGVPCGVLLLVGASLAAVSDSANLIPTFFKSGGAGAAPTLDDTDGDGRTEVAAGTGADSLYYLYDAGSGSWSAAGLSWPTPRGDFARRGNRVAPLALGVVDLTPPARISDLAVDSLSASGATLTWSAPGGDGAAGRAARYEINVTVVAGEAGRFRSGAVRTDAMTPDPAGTPQRYSLAGLAAGNAIFVAVRAVDSTGNAGAASNVVRIPSPLGPVTLSRPPGLSPLAQPSTRQVRWAWRVEDAPQGVTRELRLFDVQGRWLRTLPLAAGATGITEWDGRDHEGRVVPAGMIFARLISGSFHAQSRVVLLP